MKKQRKGYYSETLLYLPGHLHITRESASIELSAKDEDGRRYLISIPVSDTESLAEKLWNEWAESGKDSPTGIPLVDGCHMITSQEQLTCICQELSYISDRAQAVSTALFASGKDYLPCEPEPSEKKETRNINLEKAAQDSNNKETTADASAVGGSLKENTEVDLLSILDSLKENAEKKERGSDVYEKYTDLFTNLKFNRLEPYAAMAKAVLLMSVFDLIESGFIKSTKIPTDIELGKTYESNWRRYVSTNVHNQYSSYETPFIQMDEESFWRLMPNGITPDSYHSPLAAYKCAVINPDLYELLGDEENRSSLKSLLIDTYL